MSDCRHNAPNHGPDSGDVQTQWQQLDQANREELLDKLADCLFSLEGDADISSIDRYLEELEQAGAQSEVFDVERSLQEFHERYAPAFENSPSGAKKRNSRVRRPLARIAIIAAALCTFVITAQASGFDILGAIARWTSEQFAFVKVDEAKDKHYDGVYTSLQDALDEWNIIEQLAPTKFPDGTILSDLMVRREKDGLLISGKYTLREEMFRISIRKVTEAPHLDVEINAEDVEIYLAGGIEHYLMADVKQRKATWNNGNWECRISGDLSREELLFMIDSIYE